MSSTTVTIPLPSSRARWLALGIATGLLGAAIAWPAFAPHDIRAVDGTTTAPEHTIAVTGTGRVIISPDVADLRLGVQATRPTVKAARQVAAESMTKVVAALKALGIADKDIQTSTLYLQPVYDYTNNTNPPRITGYQLSNAVAVTIRDLDKVGDAIDGSLAAGATTMDGVTFRVDDPAKALSQAREAAMVQAKASADTLARSAGVTIAGVASISESGGTIPTPIPYAERTAGALAAPDKAVSTPIEAGTNEVTVTVAVSYLIR